MLCLGWGVRDRVLCGVVFFAMLLTLFCRIRLLDLHSILSYIKDWLLVCVSRCNLAVTLVFDSNGEQPYTRGRDKTMKNVMKRIGDENPAVRSSSMASSTGSPPGRRRYGFGWTVYEQLIWLEVPRHLNAHTVHLVLHRFGVLQVS